MIHPSAPVRRGHFLVVEPEPLFRLLLCVALSGQFSDFSAVSNFGEAQALLGEHHFAAIVAEYHLPGGTGLSLYYEARRSMPTVPFVLMCGGLPVSVPDPYYRFFGKPFSVAELAETLREMLPENQPVELSSGNPPSSPDSRGSELCLFQALNTDSVSGKLPVSDHSS
jgi:DNA-binding NtrC family response regulator